LISLSLSPSLGIQTSINLGEVVTTLKEQIHQLREFRRLLPQSAREAYSTWKENIQKEVPLPLLNNGSFNQNFVRWFKDDINK
jgi:hypothetical protein